MAQPARAPPAEQEYAFLVGSLIEAGTLQRADEEARHCGVAPHDVLLAWGAISQDGYAAALARHLGVPLAPWEAGIGYDGASDSLPATLAGMPCRVLDAASGTPREVAARVVALNARGLHAALAPALLIEAAQERHLRSQRLDAAVRGLHRERPEHSAGGQFSIWQIVAAAVAVGLVIGGFSVVPAETLAVLTGLMALPFLCVVLLRLVALMEVFAARRRRRRAPASDLPADHTLPVYSILVPLLREANVLPALVKSLSALDYPPAKLDIILVLEASDLETQAAVLALDLPGNVRTVVVPDQAPQTKPKALNYALRVARGDYVVVYDAEDRPQPDQLRRALALFRDSQPGLGCVQAQLNIYNPRASWVSRQFTIEYSALFDAILPALERLRLPVPLGGSSNHLPRAVLDVAGGWDPFNVTEDADLGIRLARLGYHTRVLASTTWEEAPALFGQWFRQRTRWLKGWMQTYLVHTRRPWVLTRDLGLAGALGFHALMGGLILSALVHPLFYLLLVYHAVAGSVLAPAETALGALVWSIAWINLGFGYAASILVGMLSVWRRGRPGLALSALLMPMTWLLISLAAYRALYQLVRNPYLWEKTEHGVHPRANGNGNGSGNGARLKPSGTTGRPRP